MPTYQYACTACDERLEAVQSFTDAALTECLACGGTLRKVYSAVGVVFKGSGFYKTDSREGAKKAGAKADAKTGDGDGKGESKGGESKGGDSKSGDSAPAKAGAASGSSSTAPSSGSTSPSGASSTPAPAKPQSKSA